MSCLLALRAQGKTDKQISQHLPGRSEIRCQVRRNMKLEAWTQHPGTQEKDALAIHARKKQFWSKRLEEWEDQVVVTQRTADEGWESISKKLPPRTPASVKYRGDLLMKKQPQEAITLQRQPAKKSSIPSAVKPRHYWKLEEEQLLVRLRESGKTWPEVATQLPLRSVSAIAKSVPGRTKFGAKSHWAEHFRAPDRDEPWTSGEIALLTRLRDEGSGWDEICQAIPGHTVNACRTQWYKEAEGIQKSEDI